jgi:multiple sugar transport system substrate-binding protein
VQSGGSTVDVFRLPSDLLALLIKQNLVAPIDDFLTADDKKDIFPQLLETVAHNGKHYSWPLWVPPVGMYLNLDIFAERKVTPPSDDWTYDDFVKIAQQLTFTRSDGQKIYGYTSVIDPGVVNAWPIIMGDGAIPLSKDNTRYTFNAPEGITGLQKLVDLAQKYKVTPPDFGTQSVTDIATGFSQTKTYAMYSEPSGSSAGYRAMKLNFDVRAMPIGATGKHVTTGGIGLIAVSASIQDQDRLKAAMELARYLTSKEVGDDVKGYYLAPSARQSVQVSDPINKFVPFVPYTYITPIIPQWPEIRTILHAQLQKAILGKIGVADALNGPANEINSLLSSS